MRKVLLALFLCIAMLASAGSIALAVEMQQPPGQGTEENPYEVASLAHLSWLSQHPDEWDACYSQTSDIDASGTGFWDDADENSDGDLYNDPHDDTNEGSNDGFSPIGNQVTWFDGDYEGNGHTVSNLAISRDGTDRVGFFGTTHDGTIENLTLSEVYILGENEVGAVVGANTANLTNCSSSGIILAANHAGGLVGFNRESSEFEPHVSDCHSSASVMADAYVGGLVGLNFAGVSNCHSSGGVLGAGDFVGGLVGENTSQVIECYSTSAVHGADYVGGLIGHHFRSAVTEDSWSTGDVSGGDDGNYVGGLIGANERGAVRRCYSTGDIHGADYTGGFVGHNLDSAVVTNCYSTGSVTCSSRAGLRRAYKNGGFCGANAGAEISKCYCTGGVFFEDLPDPLVGKGFLGFMGPPEGGTYIMTDNFWDMEASNQDTDDYHTPGKTTAEMQDIATFTDLSTDGLENAWDFVGTPNDDTGDRDIWDMDAGSYPYLGTGGKEPEKCFFPHIASDERWETEIALINKSSREFTGMLKARDSGGEVLSTKSVTLWASGRQSFIVGDEFQDPEEIRYISFSPGGSEVCGYTKFYHDGRFRVALPAARPGSKGTLYVPHIASDARWWTGIGLVNTAEVGKTITFSFNTGETRSISLAPGAHHSFNIKELFEGIPQPDIEWAKISNAAGVIGLELFCCGRQLSGVLIKGETSKTLYFPHIASDSRWWTGIAAYNPWGKGASFTFQYYDAGGILLGKSKGEIPGPGKVVGNMVELAPPDKTAWIKLTSSLSLNGFELFGSSNGNLLAGYCAVDIKRREGVFPKLDTDGWTGVAFVNTAETNAEVELGIYDSRGRLLFSAASLTLGGHEKFLETAREIFDCTIPSGTYLKFSSNEDVVGFQLNGSSDGMMLDGLPGM